MTKRATTIALMGGICALAFAAPATPVSAGTAFLAHNGTGSTCSQAAPCNDMGPALAVAGPNGEIICLDKGNYGDPGIAQSVTISCGDGLWEALANPVTIFKGFCWQKDCAQWRSQRKHRCISSFPPACWQFS